MNSYEARRPLPDLDDLLTELRGATTPTWLNDTPPPSFDQIRKCVDGMSPEQKRQASEPAVQAELGGHAYELGKDYLNRGDLDQARRWFTIAAHYRVPGARHQLDDLAALRDVLMTASESIDPVDHPRHRDQRTELDASVPQLHTTGEAGKTNVRGQHLPQQILAEACQQTEQVLAEARQQVEQIVAGASGSPQDRVHTDPPGSYAESNLRQLRVTWTKRITHCIDARPRHLLLVFNTADAFAAVPRPYENLVLRWRSMQTSNCATTFADNFSAGGRTVEAMAHLRDMMGAEASSLVSDVLDGAPADQLLRHVQEERIDHCLHKWLHLYVQDVTTPLISPLITVATRQYPIAGNLRRWVHEGYSTPHAPGGLIVRHLVP